MITASGSAQFRYYVASATYGMAKNSAQPDSHPIAVFALNEKRAEIAGTITELQRQIAQNRADLMHIDYTLRLIDPMFSVIETRAKRVRFSIVGYFQKGEWTRRIYDALRRSETICAAGLADEAMADKKMTDPRIRSYVVTRFLSRLGQMAVHGKLIGLRDGHGYNVRWKLASDEADPVDRR
jgi:hypothetical protein